MVLQLLEDGASFEEITRDFYPDLTYDDIKACTTTPTSSSRTKKCTSP
jgi:uncharacterized protein (DUF433 family)